MKISNLILVLFLCVVTCIRASDNDAIITKIDSIKTQTIEEKVWVRPEVLPSFPGGNKALLEYINKEVANLNIKVDVVFSGKVYVSFLVTKDGSVSDPSIVKDTIGLQKYYDEIKAIFINMPIWNPGTQRGKPVNVYNTLPISIN